MNKLIPLIVLVFFLLLIPFLWQERLSLSNTIDAEKVNAFATSVAVLLTSITIYFLHKQNQQQAKAIKAANQPDLYPAETQYQMRDDSDKDEYGNGNEQGIKNVLRFQPYPNPSNRDFELCFEVELHNIGLGAGKQIKVKWKFNRLAVFTYVDDAYFLNNPKYSTETFAQETLIDFISPTNSVSIFIPYYYSVCFGRLVKKKKKDNSIKEVPNLYLYIDYLDIYDTPISKIFKVSFRSMADYVHLQFHQDSQEIKKGT